MLLTTAAFCRTRPKAGSVLINARSSVIMESTDRTYNLLPLVMISKHSFSASCVWGQPSAAALFFWRIQVSAMEIYKCIIN